MAPNTTFESLNFNPFVVKDPDVNFLHNNVSPLDTDYISPDNFSENLKDFKENFVLHLNIRSLNKNFESFAELYKSSFKNRSFKNFHKRGLMMKILVKDHFFN